MTPKTATSTRQATASPKAMPATQARRTAAWERTSTAAIAARASVSSAFGAMTL